MIKCACGYPSCASTIVLKVEMSNHTCEVWTETNNSSVVLILKEDELFQLAREAIEIAHTLTQRR